MGLRKERWGRKVYRFCGTEEGALGGKKFIGFSKKLYFDFMFFFKILC